MLTCPRCNGKVFIDRSRYNYEHVEFFCIICGKRWEAHKNSFTAQVFNKLERLVNAGFYV